MEKEVTQLLTDNILLEASGLYGIDKECLKLVSDFENFIFEFSRDGQNYILRLTHSSHRNENLVEGELDWIHFLHRHGCSVCRPLFSENNKLVEGIQAVGSYFLATAFEKAKGIHVDRKDYALWNPSIFESWGRVVGKMHASTKFYKPSKPEYKRLEWFEDDLSENAEKYIGRYGEGVVRRHRELIDWCHSLPRDIDSYGLIHTDVHDGNFFVNNGELTVFDFDDCAYNWFMNDIAIVLFYVAWGVPSENVEDRSELTERFLRSFLKGYKQENILDSSWLRHIPNFLKYRELTVFGVVNKKWDLEALTERQRDFIDRTLYNIEKDIPFVQLDFTKFA